MALQAHAAVLSWRGRYEDAEPLLRRALKMRQAILGKDNRVLNDLGFVIAMQDLDDDRAFEVLRGADNEELRVAFLSDTIANQIFATDKERCERFLRRSWDIRIKRLGATHQSTRKTGVLLARCLDDLGRPKEVELIARVLLDVQEDQQSLIYLGIALLGQERWTDAEPVMRKTLALRKKLMPDSWLRWNAMSLLGEAVAGQKKFAEAEKLLVDSYEKMVPPPESANRKGEALERVIKLYEAWGKTAKAAEWRAKR